MANDFLACLCGLEKVLDCQKGTADIDTVDGLPGFQGQFPDVGMAGFICDACVGAEDVDGAEVGLGCFDAGGDGGLI